MTKSKGFSFSLYCLHSRNNSEWYCIQVADDGAHWNDVGGRGRSHGVASSNLTPSLQCTLQSSKLLSPPPSRFLDSPAVCDNLSNDHEFKPPSYASFPKAERNKPWSWAKELWLSQKSQIPLHQSVSDRELRMRLRKLLNNGAARMGGRRTIFTFAIVQAPRVSCCPVSLGIQKQLHLLSLSSSDSMLLFIFGCLAQCLIR